MRSSSRLPRRALGLPPVQQLSVGTIVLGLMAAACGAACAPALAAGATGTQPATVVVSAAPRGRAVPRDFLGLSFEVGSLPGMARWWTSDTPVHLLRSLGAGVVRLGGSTADATAAWSSDGHSRPAWARVTFSPSELRGFAKLVRRTGWRALLTVNLGHYDPNAAAAEVESAAGAFGRRLGGVAIGNEPDGYKLPNEALRSGRWGFAQYRGQADDYLRAIHTLTPNAVLVGPEIYTPVHGTWLGQEARTEHPAILTAHFYSLGCGRTHEPRDLLSLHVRAAEERVLGGYARIARHRRTPLRVDETNNISCGGELGVSNAYASALWAVDYLTRAMASGVAGINLHDTLDCGGYSPLCARSGADLARGRLHAQPEWYALLLARRLLGSRPVAVTRRPRDRRIAVTALLSPHGALQVVVVDTDAVGGRGAVLRLRVPRRYRSGTVLRLTAPSLAVTSGVRLGGRSVRADGRFSSARLPRVAVRRGLVTLRMAPSSAALMTLSPR